MGSKSERWRPVTRSVRTFAERSWPRAARVGCIDDCVCCDGAVEVSG